MHEDKCDGFDKKQCKICLRMFTSTDGKYQHKKKVKCVPPSSSSTNSNNLTDSDSNLNIIGDHNTAHNTTNNHYHINIFGQENLSFLREDGNLLQRVNKHANEGGVYSIVEVVKDIYCNKHVPENYTIIKPLAKGVGVYTMGAAGEWLYKEFEDIRGDIIKKTSEYMEQYQHHKEEIGVKLKKRSRETASIKNLSYALDAMGGQTPDALFDELDMSEEKVVVDDLKIKGMNRKFDKATMVKLHEHTLHNYKKNSDGKYVPKTTD
jgi:hypothetical protein